MLFGVCNCWTVQHTLVSCVCLQHGMSYRPVQCYGMATILSGMVATCRQTTMALHASVVAGCWSRVVVLHQ
jgi:hypothetical protein